jgi:hypothetical protein
MIYVRRLLIGKSRHLVTEMIRREGIMIMAQYLIDGNQIIYCCDNQ